MRRSFLALVYIGVPMGAIALADYRAGKDVSLWVLYIVPIGIVAFFGGFKRGAAATLFAGMLLVCEAAANGYPQSQQIYFLIALLNRLIAFLAIALLASVVGLFVTEMLDDHGERTESATLDRVRDAVASVFGRHST